MGRRCAAWSKAAGSKRSYAQDRINWVAVVEFVTLKEMQNIFVFNWLCIIPHTHIINFNDFFINQIKGLYFIAILFATKFHGFIYLNIFK